MSWVADMLSGGIISIPAMFVGGVVLAYRVDAVLATVILCTVPLVCVVVMAVGRKVAPLWEQSDAYIDRQNELMRQRLRGLRVIRPSAGSRMSRKNRLRHRGDGREHH